MHQAAHRKLIETWLAANDGLASEAGVAQLNEAIVADPEFRDHLLQLVQHQSWLQWNGMSECCSPCERSPELASLIEALAVAEDMEEVSPQVSPRVHSLPQTAAILLGAFAIGACLAGLAMWNLVALDQRVATFPSQQTSVADSPQMRFVSSTQCLWDAKSSTQLPVLGQALRGGESLNLLEGIAELSVTSDYLEARLHLEGPVAVIFTSRGIPMLKYGKMTLKVDGFSHESYSVETPFGRVLSQGGSEVGISSMGSKADVHAFSGSVKVESPWLITQDHIDEIETVNSGEALHIENVGGGDAKVSRTASDRDEFLPEVSMDSDYLFVHPEYIREIRQAEPVAYWRFEGAENGIVRNEMQDRFHGHIRRTVEWSGPRGNQAIQLGMSDDPGTMVVNDDWDAVLANDFAIEAWIKPSHFHRGSIIGFVGEFNWQYKKNTHGILLEVCGIPHHVKAKSLRFLHRAPATIVGVGGVDCYSDVSYIPRRWQHIVAQRHGLQMQLFHNGLKVQELPETKATPRGLKLVMGQLYSEAVERFLTGQVDEVAIYNRALTEKEIRQHHEILRPSAPMLPSI